MTGVVWAVIKREYLQRVRTRWFLIGTLAAPLLLAALLVAPVLVGSGSGERQRTISLVDQTGLLAEGLVPRLEDAGFTVAEIVSPGTEAEVSALETSVREGRLGGYLVVDDATLSRGEIRLFTGQAPSPVRGALVRQGVVQTALEVRLGGDRDDVASLLRGGDLAVEVLAEQGAGTQDPRFISAYVGAFLLYMVLIFYAVAVMRSVLEEKTSRIVEVVISSMRPFELMLGKIIGVGAVGLTQLGIWLALGALFVFSGLPMLMAARPDFLSAETLAQALPGVAYLLLFGVYFLGGYFIYSGLYAAVGATCNTDEEAQQAQFPVIMLLVVPIIFVTQVIEAPTSSLAVILSFVPFFTPILMFARAVVGGATPVEVVLSIILMGLTILAVAWVAGRIYRVGILMAGKRATLPEILRWIREP